MVQQDSRKKQKISMRFFLGFVLSTLIASGAWAGQQSQKVSCESLVVELNSMKAAQQSILESMVRKNEAMAETLDHYADQFQTRKPVRPAELSSLRKSAQSFRKHEIREKKLVDRFQAKTHELVQEISRCLKSSSLARVEASAQN